MVDFSEILYLSKQHAFIQKRLKSKNAVFLVGGCVRSLLLTIEKRPSDIDVTLTGDPIKIYKHSNKIGLSHFITEKFGTITFIKKGKINTQYEITPLRTEGGYQDFRHPEKINRSNNILLDSQRRDFTINSLYFFADTNREKKQTNNKQIDKKLLLKQLKNDGIFAIEEQNLLIIQDHDIITTLFENGIYNKEKLANIVEKYKLGKKSEYYYFIIDPNKGIQDLFNRTLRAVGDPDNRFQEDALRLIRALRFVNVLNHQLKSKKSDSTLFDFDKATRNALKRNHHLIENIAKERIKDELIKIFTKGDPFGFVALLDESHILQTIFPSVYATKYIQQPVRYHPFDVYTHTLLTLYELQKINNNYLVRLSMLYHDVGKVAQFSAYKDGLSKDEIRIILSGPLNHRKGGPELVKKDFSNLGFSNKEIDQIAWYVANHHKPEEILDGEDDENRKKKLRKFLSEAGYKKVEDILDITIADRRGQYNPLQNNSDLEDITILRKLLKKIHKEEGQFTIKELVVDGNEIMKKFSIPPGKLIGELIQKGFDRVINDTKTRNKKEKIFEYLAGYLKNKKSDS
ncbi:MAG: HD domain-containing protein [Candidatus Absconditabacteria bacterium]|nr:HD domain-containing protein [Candidatus Absconditabacteria bacterium]